MRPLAAGPVVSQNSGHYGRACGVATEPPGNAHQSPQSSDLHRRRWMRSPKHITLGPCLIR